MSYLCLNQSHSFLCLWMNIAIHLPLEPVPVFQDKGVPLLFLAQPPWAAGAQELDCLSRQSFGAIPVKKPLKTVPVLPTSVHRRVDSGCVLYILAWYWKSFCSFPGIFIDLPVQIREVLSFQGFLVQGYIRVIYPGRLWGPVFSQFETMVSPPKCP